MSPKPAAPALDPDELAHLEEQRDFLLRSLADLEREHDAGDLDDDDYEHLRDDYTARAADALRAIQQQRAAFAASARPASGRRRLLVVGGIAVFAILAGIAVATSIGARKPGDTSSGGIKVPESDSQKAKDCIAKLDPSGQNITPATNCFKQVLDDDPENVVALAWSGWQISLAAPNYSGTDRLELQAAAEAYEAKAVKADPTYSYARAFRAIVAYRNGDPVAARTFLADFRAHDPSADALATIKAMKLDDSITKLEQALAAARTTTTTTTTTSTAPTSTTTTQPG